ncbi:DeoR/GlpR family DNA-binding transcription regulator [Cellulomonas sp. HZM]|uniref:DeoR/GlpR family DNA-binding transcription regulator n=1 Tax=Cellulomonas sp. HZM TaxID=1454010 RepID=UPI0004932669|nr:DeoR/GlpR family DNA-binding transcription regulator [Cellulomonas sp. HZM]
MLADQRRDQILDEVRRTGAARVADLVVTLDVSEMTVRRDITELARRGLVHRVHGGAVDARHAVEPGFAAKRLVADDEKRAIARAALDLVAPGAAIALSAGTTTHALAELLVASTTLRPLTVVTNSAPAADTLDSAADPRLSVVLSGGTRTPSGALVGPVATASLASLRVDTLFLGVHGLDLRAGLTTPNLLEAETDRALIESASRVVVLADHGKWGTVGLSRIAELTRVDVLVTDQRAIDDAPEVVERARDLVGELVVAPDLP